jgi:hypothetical protein
MAIVSVDLIWSGEASGWAMKEGGQTSDLSHTDVYEVVVDNNPTQDSTQSVLNSGQVPTRNAAHPENYYLRCKDCRVSRKSPVQFQAVATYASRGSSGDDEDQNPINQLTRIKYATVTTQGEIDEDIDGNAIATENDELIKGIMRPFSDLSFTLTKNFPTFNPVSFYGYIDRVNSVAFNGFPPGTVQCTAIEAQPVVEDDFAYFEVSSTFTVRKPVRTTTDKAWFARVLHKGFLIKDGSDIIHAKDDNGEFVSQPVLLASDGTRETDATSADWLEFEILESVNFNSMGYGI